MDTARFFDCNIEKFLLKLLNFEIKVSALSSGVHSSQCSLIIDTSDNYISYSILLQNLGRPSSTNLLHEFNKKKELTKQPYDLN